MGAQALVVDPRAGEIVGIVTANRAHIRSIEEIAPNVFELDATMLEPREIHPQPGQYVSIHIAGSNEQRSYSIGSPPGRTDGFTLLVRGMGATAPQFLASLAVGSTIEFDGPRGDFVLVPGATGDSVFGATGVGMAPLFPMIESLLAGSGGGRVMLFWGLMHEADLFWVERLERLAEHRRFSSRLVFTALGEGFVTQPIIETAGALDDPRYYLCGNGQMVRDVIDGLTSRGVDRARQIRTDWY
jgi:ferredoxin-NADP reductase